MKKVFLFYSIPGEEELEDEGFVLENADQKSFLIDTVLLLREGQDPESGNPALIWTDVDHPSGVCSYEFVVDVNACSTANIEAFVDTIYHCMFERKYKKSKNDATGSEMLYFIEHQKGHMNQNDFANTPKTPLKSTIAAPEKTSTIDNAKTYLASSHTGICLTNVDAELYLYDARFHQFIRIFESCSVSLVRVDKFKYSLVVTHLNQPYLCQLVDPRMTPTFNAESHSFVWNVKFFN
jgi:hypothetical protein